ncbi:hypothetical protein CRUP_007732 [Coryphaenoides rupestris]|nr:hypothetical protein CRUP_007732 [Coryphaenoides rupestris]
MRRAGGVRGRPPHHQARRLRETGACALPDPCSPNENSVRGLDLTAQLAVTGTLSHSPACSAGTGRGSMTAAVTELRLSWDTLIIDISERHLDGPGVPSRGYGSVLMEIALATPIGTQRQASGSLSFRGWGVAGLPQAFVPLSSDVPSEARAKSGQYTAPRQPYAGLKSSTACLLSGDASCDPDRRGGKTSQRGEGEGEQQPAIANHHGGRGGGGAGHGGYLPSSTQPPSPGPPTATTAAAATAVSRHPASPPPAPHHPAAACRTPLPESAPRQAQTTTTAAVADQRGPPLQVKGGSDAGGPQITLLTSGGEEWTPGPATGKEGPPGFQKDAGVLKTEGAGLGGGGASRGAGKGGGGNGGGGGGGSGLGSLGSSGQSPSSSYSFSTSPSPSPSPDVWPGKPLGAVSGPLLFGPEEEKPQESLGHRNTDPSAARNPSPVVSSPFGFRDTTDSPPRPAAGSYVQTAPASPRPLPQRSTVRRAMSDCSHLAVPSLMAESYPSPGNGAATAANSPGPHPLPPHPHHVAVRRSFTVSDERAAAATATMMPFQLLGAPAMPSSPPPRRHHGSGCEAASVLLPVPSPAAAVAVVVGPPVNGFHGIWQPSEAGGCWMLVLCLKV